MKIQQAALETGISPKMIRYYEQIELIPKAMRTSSGYREYTSKDIARLNFIYQARQMGFSLDHIKVLLQLWQNEQRHSADVKVLAQQHVAQLQDKIAQMQNMVNHLQELILCCAGDNQPHCAILDNIQDAQPL